MRQSDAFRLLLIGYDLGGRFFKSLGRHCNEVEKQMLQLQFNRWASENEPGDVVKNQTLCLAAQLHDCGKPNARTEKDGKVLYYHHSNIGAYESMFYEAYPNEDKFYASALITYHMNPHDWNDDPQKRRTDMRRWGKEFFTDVELLHGCDVKANEVMGW